MLLVFSNYDDRQNPYYGGGGAHAIHEVARRLAARHDVTVVTGRYPGCRAETVDRVRYERVGAAAGPRLGQLLFQLRLPVEVRRRAFDVWIESLTPPFSTAVLPRFTRRPVIALTQVMAGRAMARKYGLPFGALERAGLRRYRYAIALSTYLQRELERINPRLRTVVIPNGVSRELIDLQVEREPAHLLFLGRVDIEQKGLDLLLQALAQPGPQLGWPVLLAGSGTPADEARLQRLLANPALAGQVRWLGRVDGAVKHDLLRRAACVVLPSRFEASPVVALEACCYAVPLVVFDIPELGDLPASCAVKVPPFDTAALRRALAELADDAPRRAALGAAAKRLATAHDWDDLAPRYADFFESLRETG